MKANPNSVVGAADKTALESLTAMLDILMDSRKRAQEEAQTAKAVLQEPPPAAFDHEAAGRAIAQARVADLMGGTNTADMTEKERVRERVLADKAAAEHEQRQADARKRLDDSNRLVQALTAQALEVDAAIRREFVADGVELASTARQALEDAAVSYLNAYIAFKAATWIGYVGLGGDGRKQFYFPDDQHETTLSAPKEIIEALPDGWKVGLGEAVIYSRQEMMGRIKQRVHEMMAARSGGRYPQIAADLPVQPDA